MIQAILVIAIILIPLSGYHAMVGAVIGLLQALAILIPLSKAPIFVRVAVSEYPLLADVSLSALAAWLTATFFGTGLMLAISVTTCAIVLSIALPRLNPLMESR